jgi:hypothetical protein
MVSANRHIASGWAEESVVVIAATGRERGREGEKRERERHSMIVKQRRTLA